MFRRRRHDFQIAPIVSESQAAIAQVLEQRFVSLPAIPDKWINSVGGASGVATIGQFPRIVRQF